MKLIIPAENDKTLTLRLQNKLLHAIHRDEDGNSTISIWTDEPKPINTKKKIFVTVLFGEALYAAVSEEYADTLNEEIQLTCGVRRLDLLSRSEMLEEWRKRKAVTTMENPKPER